ncbi:hypothetical protein BCU90_17435 [Vibrio lentus]|uniref:hypothetical protein n=1 Tax=Vibrio lentus TaxID=136468 RepID=UPI000C85E4E6|nr:hypothetical protein [Vibrio lentus]PMG45647.1 hypothetical protein BCU90_17435 [Vibrio lentus]
MLTKKLTIKLKDSRGLITMGDYEYTEYKVDDSYLEVFKESYFMDEQDFKEHLNIKLPVEFIDSVGESYVNSQSYFCDLFPDEDLEVEYNPYFNTKTQTVAHYNAGDVMADGNKAPQNGFYEIYYTFTESGETQLPSHLSYVGS